MLLLWYDGTVMFVEEVSNEVTDEPVERSAGAEPATETEDVVEEGRRRYARLRRGVGLLRKVSVVDSRSWRRARRSAISALGVFCVEVPAMGRWRGDSPSSDSCSSIGRRGSPRRWPQAWQMPALWVKGGTWWDGEQRIAGAESKDAVSPGADERCRMT